MGGVKIKFVRWSNVLFYNLNGKWFRVPNSLYDKYYNFFSKVLRKSGRLIFISDEDDEVFVWKKANYFINEKVVEVSVPEEIAEELKKRAENAKRYNMIEHDEIDEYLKSSI